MPKPSNPIPPKATDKLPDKAVDKLPDTVKPVSPEEGVFRTADDPLAVMGEGWYHYGTAADDRFLDHAGVRDVYVFDFNMQDGGTHQGADTVDFFQQGLDQIYMEDTRNAFANVFAGSTNQEGAEYTFLWYVQDISTPEPSDLGTFAVADYFIAPRDF